VLKGVKAMETEFRGTQEMPLTEAGPRIAARENENRYVAMYFEELSAVSLSDKVE
jgi:hypothetical protein